MVCFSHQFVSLLVIINLVRTECVGTRTDSLCLSQRSRSGTSIDETSSSDTVCCRLCRSIIKDQEKQSNIAFKRCIQNCKQKRDIKDKDDQALSKLRERRTIAEKRKCLGLSDRSVASPHIAEIKRVEFHPISSDKYGYNVFWKPLPEFLFKYKNWTHYSLLYQFDNDPAPDGMMKCVLIPKNNTNWTLIYHAANFDPDPLRYTVVSFPFRGSSAGDNAINLSEFDPLRPTYIPNFTPIFPTKGTEKPMAWAVPMIGGSIAGLVLIGVVFIAIMRRRSALCPSYREDPQLQAVIPRANNSRELVTERAKVAAQEKAYELYYSCYYPENEPFRAKVASIVNLFRRKGYDVIMDAMVTSEISSQGPTRWAENQIRRAKKVLVFLSPGLLKLASVDGCEGIHSQDINRVWIELEVLRDIYSRNRSAAKIVCIALPDVPVSSQDSPVWLKVSYRWPEDFNEILKRLNDRPSILPA